MTLESLFVASALLVLAIAGLILFRGCVFARLSGVLASSLFLLFFWLGAAGGSNLGLLVFGPLALLAGWLVAKRVNGDYC